MKSAIFPPLTPLPLPSPAQTFSLSHFPAKMGMLTFYLLPNIP